MPWMTSPSVLGSASRIRRQTAVVLSWCGLFAAAAAVMISQARLTDPALASPAAMSRRVARGSVSSPVSGADESVLAPARSRRRRMAS